MIPLVKKNTKINNISLINIFVIQPETKGKGMINQNQNIDYIPPIERLKHGFRMRGDFRDIYNVLWLTLDACFTPLMLFLCTKYF